MGLVLDSVQSGGSGVPDSVWGEDRQTTDSPRSGLRRLGVGSEGAQAQDCAERSQTLPRLRNKDSGRNRRRGASIHAYVGANGSGKSLAMVHDTLPSLEAGRTVLSTVRLLDAETGLEHPSYVRLTDWSQLLEAEHADVLFDEVVGIANSRDGMGMPVQIANLLVQLRRRDLVLRWTAPAWARADRIIRECTQAVTVCHGYMSKREKNAERLWAPKRLFKWSTFSAIDFDDADTSSLQRKPKSNTAWFRGPGSLAFASYDTLDQVERVGEVLDSGRCVHCGGRRQIPRCSC